MHTKLQRGTYKFTGKRAVEAHNFCKQIQCKKECASCWRKYDVELRLQYCLGCREEK